tara:strand:+ start:567 stop:944 length:378 start_codon:yes stop_codon:yes gene_type:complete
MRNILNITFLIFLNVAFSDKKYNITNVNIVGQLNQDGSMDIIEERTYYFKGKFKYAFQNLNISDEIKYSDIAVFEEKNEIFYWYGHSDSRSPQSVSGFANSFNFMVSITSSTVIAASGTGGGGAG